MTTWQDVVDRCREWPQTEESTSYGQPALKVKGKLFARMREEGGAISVRATFDEREALMAAAPEVFYITDHYKNYEWVLIRLDNVPEAVLEEMLQSSWMSAAPPRVRKEWDAARQAG